CTRPDLPARPAAPRPCRSWPAPCRSRPARAPAARAPASARRSAGNPYAHSPEDRDVVGDAAAAQNLLRQQEIADVEAQRHVVADVELESQTTLPGQPHDRLVERPPGARDHEDVRVDDGL